MSKEGIEPTYVGDNENLVFIVPTELFTMKITPGQALSPKDAKEFSAYIRDTFKGFEIANKTKYGNENNTKTVTTAKFWENFERKAKEMGVDLIGYTPVNKNYIFKNLKIYGKNAIVLGMEMKWEKIKTAPSIYCGIEVFRVYKELGDITIELTNYLKQQGYKSEAHHPFGGKLLFTAHAVAANLGIMGSNGLVITPEFGPRQRWSIISTDAVIPIQEKRDFSKMKEFCEKCGACITNCKGRATYKTPIKKDRGIITHIDRMKCMESLIQNNYCSYCLRICPQGQED